MTQSTLVRNFSALFGGQVVAQIAGVFTTVVLARALEPEAYGIIGFGGALLSYFGLAVVFGTDRLVMREIARDPSAADRELPRLIGLRIALLIVTGIFYLGVVELIDQPERVKNVMRIQSLGLVAAAISLDFVFQGLQRMKLVGLRQAVSSALVLVLTLVFVGAPEDVFIAAAIPHAVLILTGLWLAWHARRATGGLSVAVDPPGWGRMLRRGLPFAVTGFMATIYLNIDIVMLGFMETQRSVGLYAGAVRIHAFACILGGLLVATFLPSLSSLFGRPQEMRAHYRTFARAMLFVGVPTAVGIAGFAPEVITVLLGAAFLDAAPALILLMAAAGLNYANQVGSAALTAWNEERAQMYAQGAGAAMNVVLNLVLIPLYGLIGAACATIASEFAVFVFMNLRTASRFGVTSYRPVLLTGGAAALALLAALGAGRLGGDLLTGLPESLPAVARLVVFGGIFGLVYLAIVWRAGLADVAQIAAAFRRRRD